MPDRDHASDPTRSGSSRRWYRAVLVDSGGRELASVPIAATIDDVAVIVAQTMVNGYAIDLWQDQRFIEHFPLVDKAG